MSLRSRVGLRRVLLPAILTGLLYSGCISLPPEDSSVIALPVSEGIYGNWESLGVLKGEKAPDFTLYSQEGRPFHLYEELKKGKPIVLINGSYTCDVSRANLPAIQSITERYKEDLDFYMIYTIEPHPSDSPSPYSENGETWISKNNIRDSVEAGQPKTYADRVELSLQWKTEYHIDSPVLVDSPDNTYWENFGQAPNMTYIIDPDGTVYYKQAWFRKEELQEHIQSKVE